MRWCALVCLVVLLVGCSQALAMMESAVEEPPPMVESDAPEDILIEEASDEQLSAMRAHSEKHQFQAEVNRIMDIIVNSLYRSKEIFLRELISNAYDALDKIRFFSLRDPSVLESNPDLSIRIKLDPVSRTLTVQDSGIGMTRAEMLLNLGTIAKSGTKDFIKKLDRINDDRTTHSSSSSNDELSSQIGQFGVGLYSVFLVAERVVIVSKSNDDHNQHVWEADPTSFNISLDVRGTTLKRGTSVTLYLNQESSEFLEERKVVDLVKKYSEFIQFPIYIWSDLDDSRKHINFHWKHINDVEPIWMRPVTGISEQDYEKFYNFVYYGKEKEHYSKPFGIIHFSAEGETTFRALLFIPDRLHRTYVDAPLTWNMRLRLCVRRVFITDETKDFLPHYLSYVGGVVDSDDLPLNVGRESLQHNQLIKVVKKKLVRKILDHFKKIATTNDSEYERFYLEFGNTLKFGIIDDQPNANRIAQLLRFYSSSSSHKQISLSEYISRMKPGQPALYYLTASSVDDAKKSPYMEKLRGKGYEVLFMTDNIDESVMQNLRSFEDRLVQHIAKEGNEVTASKSEELLLKEKELEFKPLLNWLKKSYLKEKVAAVKVSNRLLTSSCILIASEHGYSGNMDRIIRSQAYVHGRDSGFDEVLNQPKNIELNPFHPMVKIMLQQVKDDPDNPELKSSADICLSVATLAGGYSIRDGVGLSRLVEHLFLKTHNVNPDDIDRQIRLEQGLDGDDLDDDDNDADKDSEVFPDSSSDDDPVDPSSPKTFSSQRARATESQAGGPTISILDDADLREEL